MDNCNINLNQIQENYQLFANPIPNLYKKTINTTSSSYQINEIKTKNNQKFNKIYSNNKIYPQIIYRKNLNCINLDMDDNLSTKYSKSINRLPEDANKIPKDNIRNKINFDSYNKYSSLISKNNINKTVNNCNINNITTINNNNFNKINSINIILDGNNIYNNINFIQKNNSTINNRINTHENINTKININENINNIKNINNIEEKNKKIEIKQPKDNYKNYLVNLNQNNNGKSNKSNKNIIRLKKLDKKNEGLEEKSIIILNSKQKKNKVNYLNNNTNIKINLCSNNNRSNLSINSILNTNTNINKKNENNKINNISYNKINSKNTYQNNNKNNKDQKKMNVENNDIYIKKNFTKKNSKYKYEKKTNNNKSINHLKIKESKDKFSSINILKSTENKCLSTKRSSDINNNNLFKKINENSKKIKLKKNEDNKIEKIYFSKNEIILNKNESPSKTKTFHKIILDNNISTKIKEKNNKSQEKEKSNFASLINEKKLKIFNSLKQFNKIQNSNDEKINDLTPRIDESIFEIKLKSKINKNKKNKSNILEDLKKDSKIYYIKNNFKESINKKKRYYSPQLSRYRLPYTEIKRNETFDGNKKEIKKIILTRNISYKSSFNIKKNNLFKKNIDIPTPKTVSNIPSRVNTNKFNSLNQIEDSMKINTDNLNKCLTKSYSKKIEKGKDKWKDNDFCIINLDKKEKKEEKFENNLSIKNNKSYRDFLDKNFNYSKTNKNHEKKIKNIDISNSKTFINYMNNSNQTSTKNINKTINYKNYLNWRNSTYKNDSPKFRYNNKLNNRTTRIIKKKVVYSRYSNKEKFGFFKQKKNLFSFNKRTYSKRTLQRCNTSEEKKFIYNNASFRGFSSSKKLEEIKKKYKFRPKSKEKKNNLKERNINYIGESKGFSQLISSANLIDDNLEEEKYNINTIRCFNNKENDKNKENKFNNKEEKINNDSDKKINKKDSKNIYMDSAKKSDENDLINNKSFILDLNNVIPINGKEPEILDNKTILSNKGNNKTIKLS